MQGKLGLITGQWPRRRGKRAAADKRMQDDLLTQIDIPNMEVWEFPNWIRIQRSR
jgi:hypothetical protein